MIEFTAHSPASKAQNRLRYIGQVFVLTLLYIVSGKIGLLLAVPPGYATIIWPASGIAIGMLLCYGWRIWPGIFLGSFLLNAYVSDVFSFVGGMQWDKVLVPMGIATGSTLQALFGYGLVARLLGLPLMFLHIREVFRLFFLTAPVACVVAASVGIVTLRQAGLMAADQISANWMTWWLGDLIGVIVFMPLVLIVTKGKNQIRWQGTALNTLSVVGLLTLLVPLGATIYGWKVTSENVYRTGEEAFENLTVESTQALLYRMDSYNHGLLAAKGFLQGSDEVTADEWRTYVEAMNLKKTFPGTNGLGYIQRVAEQDLERFVKNRQKDSPGFKIHPKTKNRPYDIVRYIEPMSENALALGLNIAFEDKRLQALNLARDTGDSTITHVISLVQDNQNRNAFLLMHPIYTKGERISTQEERRKALRGWIYMPLIGEAFLDNLTNSQKKLFHLLVYDGTEEKPEALIYSSNKSAADTTPAYTIRKTVNIMQHQWLLVWQSTYAYERMESSQAPFFIIFGGLLFTVLFGIFLMLTMTRRTETMEWLDEKRYWIPLLIFAFGLGASYYLYNTLLTREAAFIKSNSEDEAQKVDRLISVQIGEKIPAIKRMAQRWESARGTPHKQWLDDTSNYVGQIGGLTTVEWIDPTFHVKWINPLQGNEKALGLNVRAKPERRKLVEDAAQKYSLFITPPLDVVQGYKAFIAYASIHYDKKFHGLIAGVFSVDEFFKKSLSQESTEGFNITLAHEGKVFYRSASSLFSNSKIYEQYAAHRNIGIYNTVWELSVAPTKAFVESRQSHLPLIIFVAGLLITALLSLSVHYILIARLRSSRLLKANYLNDAILSSSSYMIIAVDRDGQVILFNKAAEDALGYRAAEIVGKATPEIWHDSEEMETRAAALSEELGTFIEPGFRTLVEKADRYDQDTYEWTFVRKDGGCFPVSLTVTALGDPRQPTGYLGIAEDISERKAQQKALQASEAMFRSSMKYAAIGMALVDFDGRWLEVNPAVCDILGYSPEELRALDFQTITHPDDLEKDLENVHGILDGKIQTYQMVKRYIHKEGRIVWANLSVSLARDAEGEPQYFISQIMDITKEREAERVKAEFVSIVSHELRTPLTAIRGSLGLIIGSLAAELPEKVKRLIGIAHENSERLILLINDILDIDKIASGHMRFDIKTEDLGALLQKSIDTNTPYADKFGVKLRLSAPDSPVTVHVDAARFLQVITNLVSNACKFSPEGETVDVSTTLLDRSVRVYVKDRGPGIPEEFRSRIFGKFSQADSSITRSKGGTGLGLNISKEIIERMNGSIGFDTEAGHGTMFWIELPLDKFKIAAPPVPASKPAAPAVEREKEADTSQRLPQILHIEDDVGLVSFFKNALSEKAEVVEAPSLQEASKQLSKQDFDLIILDIGLPDGSGIDFFNHLRATEKYAGIPVIILSASDAPSDVKDTAASHLVKSRTSEAKIIEEILGVIAKHSHGKRP